MKVRVYKPLNQRIGKPTVNSPKGKPLEVGDILKVEGIENGDNYKGCNTWFKTTEGTYVWSGGIEFPWYIQDFNIQGLWNRTKGEKVNVVLLDTGFFPCPDIPSSRVKVSHIDDFADGTDTVGHGTLMASIIGGQGNDIIGIAPACQVISIKIFNSSNLQGWNNFLAGLKKLEELVNKEEVYVINCSCAGLASSGEMEQVKAEIDRLSQEYKMVFVSAVGNDFYYNTPSPSIVPAIFDNVVSVAGFKKINGNYSRLLSSNFWENIHITSPGEFYSSFLSSHFPHLDSEGSSHACAFTSGLIALYLSSTQPQSDFYKKVSFFIDKNSKEVSESIQTLKRTITYKIISPIARF